MTAFAAAIQEYQDDDTTETDGETGEMSAWIDGWCGACEWLLNESMYFFALFRKKI